MRKKIGLALAVVFTLAALQWAVASVDTQPATQKVGEEAVKSCPDKAKCPMTGEAKDQSSEAAKCPYSEVSKS